MKKKFMLLKKIGILHRGIIGNEIENDLVLFKEGIIEYRTSIENCFGDKDYFVEFKGKKPGDKEHKQLIKEKFVLL